MTFFKTIISFMSYNSPIFKLNINIICLSINNDSHQLSIISSICFSYFSKIRVSNFTYFKTIIRFMTNNSTIFKLNINIFTISISNNSHQLSIISSIYFSYFSKIRVSNFTFFKTIISFMSYNSAIFKLNINVFITSISNNSHQLSIISSIYFSYFSKIRVSNFAIFKTIISFMSYNSTVFKLNINVIRTSISNNSHHLSIISSICFSYSIFSSCHLFIISSHLYKNFVFI